MQKVASRAAPIVILMAIAGCQTGPTLVTFKPGTTHPERQFAFDQCKIESLQVIPQAMATQTSGGYYNPGTVQCSTIGNYTSCNRVGAVNIPATSSTHDQNQQLRDRFLSRCLASRGYQLLERPICQSEAERQQAYSQPQPATPDQVKCSSGVFMDT
ncbi:MAG TPA: hypothetical protein VGX71_13545 [Pseudaminobacter sp.]|nr:hypothetical protein [Pseudaminobacter sp.]